MSGGIPAWERLRAPDRRALLIRPLERRSFEVATVADGDLPACEGATVFDAWHEADGIVLRAATLRDVELTPYLVHATALEISGSDGRLEALLAGRGPVAGGGELERLACACRGIAADTAYSAIGAGWRTAEAVKRATRIAFGVCQGRRCLPWLADRLELRWDDQRAQITPRPPLVPVPASLLAAYAEEDARAINASRPG